MNKLYSYSLMIFTMLSMSACSLLPQRTQYSKVQPVSSKPAPTQRAKVQQKHLPEQRPQYRRTTKPRVSSQQQRTSRPQVSSQQRAPQHSQVASNTPARGRMVNIAHSTLGVPYKWGGNSPQRGFDCSGLTSYVYKNALGIKIPRTTAQQRDQSRTISYAQLKPGDMLFFKTGSKTNHVGIYVGNRKFIHAPSSGKRVTVASMDSSYWFKRFVKFGTFIK